MKKQRRQPGALTAETREIILAALAQKAAAGNTAAAKIYLDEYRAQHGTDSADPLLSALLNMWDRAAEDAITQHPDSE